MFRLLTKLRQAKARKARRAAIALVMDAEARRDDRDLGRARMVLQEATHRELKASPALKLWGSR